MKARNSNGEIKKIVLQANDSIPANGIIDFDGDVVPEGYEQVEEVEDLKEKVTFNENYANAQFKKIGKLININYQGENKEHTTGEILFTIPEKYRPKATITAGTFAGGLVGENVAYGSLFIRNTGVCEIATIKNGGTSQRLLFNMTYVLD